MTDYLVDLEEGEEVVREVRKHIFVFALEVFVLAVLALAPLLIAVPAANYLAGVMEGGALLFAILYVFWVLVLWVAFFFRWTDYYLDVWIITNKRVFDVDQRGMFNRSTQVLRLERIEDVTVTIAGVLPTLLKYGDIHIHTAGSHDVNKEVGSDITIRGAQHPLEVKRVIMETHDRVMRSIGKPRKYKEVSNNQLPPPEAVV